jgi:hypothetical protein
VDVTAVIEALTGFDPSAADRHALEDSAAVSAQLRAWLDGFDIRLGRSLEAKSGYGAKVLADAMNLSLAAGTRVIERGDTLAVLPEVEAAVMAGDVSGGHVDAATRALRNVDAKHRGALASIIDAMVGEARSLPINEYERRLRVEVRRLQDDDDQKRQKASVQWRSWIERISGMLRGDPPVIPRGRCGSTSGFRTRSTGCSPTDDAPDDPIARQQFLAGLAVCSLLLGEGAAVGKPELIVVDASNLDAGGKPTVDWGLPVDLPDEALRDVAARARLHVVTIWPPRDLDLGRSQRLASAAQRRALRALCPTCAIPGCEVRFSRLRMHQVWLWEHGGPTDLDNLLPICTHHHSRVHDHGWQLKLLPDRTLEVTFRDGETMTAGPPLRASS